MTDDQSAATAAELDEIEAGLLEFGYSQTNNRKAYAALRALRKQLAEAQKQARMLQVAYDGIGSLLLDLQNDCIAAVQDNAKKDAALRLALPWVIIADDPRSDKALAAVEAAITASQEAPASTSADEPLYGPATRTAPSLFAPASPSPGLNIDRTIPVPECLDEAMAAAGLPTSKDNAGLHNGWEWRVGGPQSVNGGPATFAIADEDLTEMVRAAVIEECAQAAWGERLDEDNRAVWNAACASCFAAIRALSRPVSEREGGQ